MDPNRRCTQEKVQRQRSVSETSSGPKYTETQRRVVDRVLHAQNHYDILRVKRDATTDVIISAYKKLALRLHPDKNKAPQAEQAFQVLGNAKDELTDPVKRKLYDMKLQQKQQQLNVSSDTTFSLGEIFITVGLAFIGIGVGVALWKASQEQSKEDGGKSQNEKISNRQTS